ncbi:MAG: hypothetical protein JWP35_4706 [Caulobacter sp.]|nr:hypothetical protein [Caulobacter sp.]
MKRSRSLLFSALVLTALAATPVLARPGLDAKLQADGVTILEDEKPVLFYRTKPADPQGQPGRANYIHPLYAPDGAVLTEDAAHDFPEQRGVFWAWRRVMLNGETVADGWGLSGLVYVVRETRFDGEADGSADLTLTVDWIVSSRPEVVYVATEVTRVHIAPLRKGVRRLTLDTVITPRVDGLSLGGSDDAKGYGGFALRLMHADQLAFASGGKTLTPQAGAVATGPSVGFAWASGPDLPAWSVGVACKADGKALTGWVLRAQASMQNCAFPGRGTLSLGKDRPLHLQETLVIRPRTAP